MAVDLSFSETGAGEPLVILHGLFGSKRNWASIARPLAAGRRVLTVDLRNHGESPWNDVHDYPALADDVARLIANHAGGRAAVMGHSMGGKAAMTLALSRPELVERLVVVDIAPARSPASPLELIRAMRAVPLDACSRRAEVEAALAAAVPDPAVRSFLAQNVRHGPDGLAWGVNLAALEHNVDAIGGFPAPPPGVVHAGPTLFVGGGRSEYLRPHHRPAIERLFPGAAIDVIEDAGHWVHAEAQGPFLGIVSRFLAG